MTNSGTPSPCCQKPTQTIHRSNRPSRWFETYERCTGCGKECPSLSDALSLNGAAGESIKPCPACDGTGSSSVAYTSTTMLYDPIRESSRVKVEELPCRKCNGTGRKPCDVPAGGENGQTFHVRDALPPAAAPLSPAEREREHPIHPWYGACDGFADGECHECCKFVASMKEREAALEARLEVCGLIANDMLSYTESEGGEVHTLAQQLKKAVDGTLIIQSSPS